MIEGYSNFSFNLYQYLSLINDNINTDKFLAVIIWALAKIYLSEDKLMLKLNLHSL